MYIYIYIYIYTIQTPELRILSRAIYTHAPARKSSTSFQLYYFAIQICSTNWLGHGHEYKWHSSNTLKAF